MAITITGDNYSQISSLDTVTTGGSWDGQTPQTDSGAYKEGGGSVAFVCKTNGSNTMTFTPTSPIDMSGTKHLRFWMLSTHGGDFTSLEIGLYDGSTTTGYWNVAPAAEYPGGWYSCMIDVSSTVDSGTKPTNMNNIVDFIFELTLSGGKNAVNFWIDNLIYCDGLVMYGDNTGSFDLEDAYDTGISEATGVLESYGGTLFCTGKLTIGDTGTNNVDFESLSETLIFKDKSTYLNTSLYSITCVGNATGATQDIYFGTAAGTSGVSGSFIKCAVASMAFEFTATDTDLHNFGLYGNTFDTYGTMDFMVNAAGYEIISNNFNTGQGQVQPNTMTFTGNTVVGGVSTDGSVLYESTSHNITYTTYVNNSRATEFTVADTYGMTGDTFIGGTYDIHFSAATGNLIINLGGDPKSDASSGQVENDSTGDVTINNTVSVTITVTDADGAKLEGARVFMEVTSGATDWPHEDTVTITSSGVTATVTHATHGMAVDELVEIEGANEVEYNGVWTIVSVPTAGTYTYTMSNDPDGVAATGTVLATYIIMQELSVVTTGIAQNPGQRYISNAIPFSGWARKSSSAPFYRTTPFTGTIDNADYSTTVILNLDQ